MEISKAVEMVKELGHIYAVSMAERGYNLDEHTPLMNGLAAYHMLELKNEIKDLDESIHQVVMLAYEMAVEQSS